MQCNAATQQKQQQQGARVVGGWGRGGITVQLRRNSSGYGGRFRWRVSTKIDLWLPQSRRAAREPQLPLSFSLSPPLIGWCHFLPLCAWSRPVTLSLFLSVFLLIAVIKVFVVAVFSHMSHAASVSPRQPPAFCRLPAQLLDPSNEIAFSCRRQTQCKGCHRNKESAQYTFFICKLKTDLSVISSQNQLFKK